MNRQTDGQTDRILIARPRLHSIQRGKNEQLEPMNFKHNRNFFYLCWLAATSAACQQHAKIFLLATSTLLQVPVPVPVLKIQVPVQVPVLCRQVQVPVPEKCT